VPEARLSHPRERALDVGRALQDGEPVDGWHGAIEDVRVFAREQIGEVVAHRY
jgi:hypothetical protein